jgi:hypothetical protein
MLVAMPGVEGIPLLKATLEEAKELSVGAHEGAAYYTRGTRNRTARIDQNADNHNTLVTCAGAFLKIVAPGSTLAQSPAFSQAEDEATTLHSEWVRECRAYKEGLETKTSAELAKILTGVATLSFARDELLIALNEHRAAECVVLCYIDFGVIRLQKQS